MTPVTPPLADDMYDPKSVTRNREERIYAAACDYEETLSPARLFDFIGELLGSVAGFLVLRR
jgi:hypothetical protein